jgi:hypothetical protein
MKVVVGVDVGFAVEVRLGVLAVGVGVGDWEGGGVGVEVGGVFCITTTAMETINTTTNSAAMKNKNFC